MAPVLYFLLSAAVGTPLNITVHANVHIQTISKTLVGAGIEGKLRTRGCWWVGRVGGWVDGCVQCAQVYWWLVTPHLITHPHVRYMHLQT